MWSSVGLGWGRCQEIPKSLGARDLLADLPYGDMGRGSIGDARLMLGRKRAIRRAKSGVGDVAGNGAPQSANKSFVGSSRPRHRIIPGDR